MSDLISREETYKILCKEYPLLQKDYLKRVIDELPSAESEAYNRGWKDGREALRKEIWEDGRDRLD